MVAIPSDMCLMVVQLKTLPQNRQQPSLQEDRFNQGIISLLQQGLYIVSQGLNCMKGIMLWFSSLVLLFFLSLHYMLPLLSQDSSHIAITIIFLSWDCFPLPNVHFNPYAVHLYYQTGDTSFTLSHEHFYNQFSHISYMIYYSPWFLMLLWLSVLTQQVFLKVYKILHMYLVPYSWSAQYKCCIFPQSWVTHTNA